MNLNNSCDSKARIINPIWNISQPKSKEVLEKEKLANKYKQYIEDSFDAWDDLINGFKFKTKLLYPEDDEKAREDNQISRNPK